MVVDVSGFHLVAREDLGFTVALAAPKLNNFLRGIIGLSFGKV